MGKNCSENIKILNFVADDSHNGWLVRDIVKKHYRISAKTLARIKRREDGIMLNGKRVTVRAVVRTGDVLSITLAEEPKSTADAEADGHGIIPVHMPLDIVYEDEDIIIINKPPFMPTHPSHGHLDDTLANALAYLYRVERGMESYVFRTVNRLDRNTSGLLCVAKNKYSASVMCANMIKGRIHKTYIAVVDEIPQNDCGIIDTYMRRREKSVIMRVTCGEDAEGAMRALTRYKVIGRGDGHSLVRLEPLTGRTHQLRVHMAYLGCPITGDGIYGREDVHILRHALHAESLELPMVNADTEEWRRFSSPIPEDMLTVIERYRITTL